MRAILIPQTGSADMLTYDEIDTPVPGSDEVLIRVQATGVSYGDIVMREGNYPDMPPLPLIPGYEAAGIVETLGKSVDEVWRGRRVLALVPGCNAEYICCPLSYIAEIPANVDFVTAVALGLNYVTANQQIGRASCRERV